ncbi:transposase [Streptomyces europaeiscabiei]|uniref:Transposase n=1 Tax=Streptomyces europaeiscabiei TaxID=146819 RepID=A0AAJ2PJY9_9ACTN|nr:transposase [Streptomyces europaeiscabiei]MDX3128447.1 transposase [Streptomyces europaeiscabiei]
MTDAEWAEARAAMPVPAWLLKRGGRPEAYCHRTMHDAVRYLVDNGVKWTAMPVDFPYWRAVYDFFRRWRAYDYARELYERLRRSARERAGRNAEPSAGVIDSRSVDASETVGEDSRGYDGGKSRDGRKRHILTDTEALLETFMQQPGRLLQLVWVDSAYRGPALTKAFARHGVRTEVVRRSDGQRGFVILARRWVVERTLSRLSRSRRLNRDHERRPDHHAQMVWWAAVIRLSRRLAADAPRWPEKRPSRLLRAQA